MNSFVTNLARIASTACTGCIKTKKGGEKTVKWQEKTYNTCIEFEQDAVDGLIPDIFSATDEELDILDELDDRLCHKDGTNLHILLG